MSPYGVLSRANIVKILIPSGAAADYLLIMTEEGEEEEKEEKGLRNPETEGKRG